MLFDTKYHHVQVSFLNLPVPPYSLIINFFEYWSSGHVQMTVYYLPIPYLHAQNNAHLAKVNTTKTKTKHTKIMLQTLCLLECFETCVLQLGVYTASLA